MKSPLLPDLLCDFPLKSEVFSLAVHPREPVISVGLAKGHVTTLRLPTPGAWPEDGSGVSNTIFSLPDAGSATIRPAFPPAAKKRVSISNKILSATPGSASSQIPASRLKNIVRPCNLVDILWQTRRHKVSCRDLAFSTDGEILFSGGGDSILKASNAETGKVITKILLPPPGKTSRKPDVPVVLQTLSPQTLLVGTESAVLHVLDLRVSPHGTARHSSEDGSTTVFETVRLEASYTPHPNDFISSISLVPPTEASSSGFSKQWISSGGGTLALTDLRKGILFQSDNHFRDFLSSLVIKPRTGGSQTEQVLAASDFSTSIPIFNKSDLNIEVGNLKCVQVDESIDAMTIVPTAFQAVSSEGDGDVIACASSSGQVRLVATTSNARRRNRLAGSKCEISQFPHAELEPVNALKFDVYGRMIVGGGHTVRVWSDKMVATKANRRSLAWRSGGDSDSDSDEDNGNDGDDTDEDAENDLRSEEDEASHNGQPADGGDVATNGSSKRKKRLATKLSLSDAWKFSSDAKQAAGSASVDRDDPSEPARQTPKPQPRNSLPEEVESDQAGDGHDSDSGSDSDPSFQPRKKRKPSSNLPSGGATVSFDGLD